MKNAMFLMGVEDAKAGRANLEDTNSKNQMVVEYCKGYAVGLSQGRAMSATSEQIRDGNTNTPAAPPSPGKP